TAAQHMIQSAEAVNYGLSERADFYEAIREQQAQDAYQRVDVALRELRAPKDQAAEDKDDIFIRVAELVDRDRTDYAPYTGHDNVEFAAGRYADTDLDKLTYEERVHELRHSPETLARAEKTIGLLVNQGIYKLAKWGNGSQLDTALSLLKS